MPRRIPWTAAIAIAWMCWGRALCACPVCYRIDDGPTTAGIRAAVVVLVGVTGAVLCGFGAFVARYLRRTRVTEGE
jgi:hypothetical protein